ncbi:Subtilisin-like protease [Thalictrum thalictroides]|uniref:Subtilisin-like protease n=1 Tax=Thalictrum thalictroides TaxID=46969 RepID=A0A7J6VPC5_THATH|nr:Subtilisin-like protease [Thalictrum thalictroides]
MTHASTVVNTAPWIFTVAASNIDRDFQSAVVLGNGHVLKGSAINFSNLTASKKYPLAYGREIAAPSTPWSEASNCIPGSLDTKKTAGKIIVCTDTDPMVTRRIKKLVAEDANAKGMILIDEDQKGVPFDSGVFPFSQVRNIDGYKILKYISSTRNPTATILSTVDINKFKPAPVVAYFSSRGPGALTETIIKPDVTAPGVGILAAMIPKVEIGSIPKGKKPSQFGIRSGTSMACPHVAGTAALIKSIHPTWSSSMIKSALMTTEDFISDLNYPSISISKLEGRRQQHYTRTITRTVTNVGPKNSTYIAKIDCSTTLGVAISPKRLSFSPSSTKASFKVSFYDKGAPKGYSFGSITWSDGVHFVRTNFAVNVV